MFLEILMRGFFIKAHHAAAEGPKIMMALSDTVAFPFGYSCAIGAESNSSRTNEGEFESGEGRVSSFGTVDDGGRGRVARPMASAMEAARWRRSAVR
jgi:hypothetical protein